MWTVPQPVLRLVALLLLACAVGAFALGLLGADPGGGRLPGEAPAPGEVTAPVAATDARPLDDGSGQAQAPAEPTQQAAAEAPPAPAADPQVPALQVAEDAAPNRPAPPPAAPAQKAPPPAAPRGDVIGDLVDGLTPSELPPF